MKKLIIAAAIVCAAACSHATSYLWGNASYSIDNWAGNAPVDADLGAPMYKAGMMYLYLGTVGYTEGKGFDFSLATLLNNGGYDAVNYVYGNADMTAYSTSDAVNKMGGDAYTLILTEGGKSLAEMANGDHFVMRTGTSGSLYDGDLGDFTADFLDTNAIGASDWTKYNTAPEPTSGLLLLLGVAGLALKRRRA